MKRPVTCEVQACRKRVSRVIGYWHEWAKRVHMKEGMIPCYRQRLFFVCNVHDTDGSYEEFLGILPIARYDEAIKAFEEKRKEEAYGTH